ncbi:MAG: pilus assembly protein TadG-related protein [Acidimicrobiia bacterium]
MKNRLSQEHGAALVVAAIVLLLVFALVALALDGGRGLDEHRSVQNGADHAAIAAAWAKCHGDDPIAAGEVFALANGYSPGELILNPNYAPASVEAIITTSIDGQVSPVIGVSQIDIADRAVASCYFQVGGGDLPFGAPGGGFFDGTLQVGNPCNSGNCQPLRVPRDDSNGTSNWIIRNISLGTQPDLSADYAFLDASGVPTCQAGDPTCWVFETDTGVSAGHLSDGLVRGSNSAAVDGRLENLGPASLNWGRKFFTPQSREVDGDYWHYSLNDTSSPPLSYPLDPSNATTIYGLANIQQAVADGMIDDPALGTWKSPWVPQVHGDFMTVTDPNERHIYYDGPVYKCDSPRLAEIPVVTDDLLWNGTLQPPPLSPSGNKDVKVIGFYDIFMDRPLYDTDLNNGDVLKITDSFVIWYGPNSSCVNGWEPGQGQPSRYIVTLDE